MLGRSLRQCRDNGWTTEELMEPEALEWVARDVANRIQQAGRVYYYWDYLRVAYDDIGEPGVLIDNVRRQLPFDAAADDGGATGDTDGAPADPTEAQASPTPRQSPWTVSDDHETGEAATLQAGLDYSDDQWLSPAAAAAGTALQQIQKMEGKRTNPYHISTVSDSDTEIPYNWTPIPIPHIIGPRRCVEAKGTVIPLPWTW